MKKILITAWTIFLLAVVAITIVQNMIGMTLQNFNFTVGMTTFWFLICCLLTFVSPEFIE